MTAPEIVPEPCPVVQLCLIEGRCFMGGQINCGGYKEMAERQLALTNARLSQEGEKG